ncbi:pilus assembly protein TadG-related protein [Pseudarthrobacter sp. NamE5]|uniref:pilus assembly protein TadG-related protein n=1 Tax=Pseudarthrobacter sp. NamE5 TaxID=2576839 RepID=UPI00110BB7AF|nr:TadE/TadG family type IV pilus assembly protein [Pseudarthrobacter sp. NamE5]TLM85917.1 pilus assembly protein TadG [Pseudarthrobacter sp. NamE5]
MRRLTIKNNKEHGAISVIVAILMVTLLGFVAIAVDVGVIYSERAQLQNGADASAIALAQKCARNAADADCSTTSTLAGTLANQNALDGMSKVHAIELDKTARKVSVTTTAKEQGGTDNSISLLFAKAIGIPSKEVGARSSAVWGTPSRGPVILPLAIAHCKLNIPAGGAKGAEQVLEQSVNGCGGIPGGFGWMQTTSTKCSITATAGASSNSGIWFSSDTGASAPSTCTAADFAQMNNQTVLLPLYDIATGTGSSGKYYIKGFAAFHVTGYQFASIGWTAGSKVANKTIRGYFVKYVSLAQGFELGSTPDYGAAVTRLTL